jgi:hypothetical protein
MKYFIPLELKLFFFRGKDFLKPDIKKHV